MKINRGFPEELMNEVHKRRSKKFISHSTRLLYTCISVLLAELKPTYWIKTSRKCESKDGSGKTYTRHIYTCPRCGKKYAILYNYCPECGSCKLDKHSNIITRDEADASQIDPETNEAK